MFILPEDTGRPLIKPYIKEQLLREFQKVQITRMAFESLIQESYLHNKGHLMVVVSEDIHNDFEDLIRNL